MKTLPGTKRCSKCRRPRRLIEFNRLASAPDGLQYCCKPCLKEARNSDEIKESGREYRKTTKGRWNQYLSNCRLTNRDFTLNYEEFESLIRGTCTYCGEIPAMGIDRVANDVGYEIGNVVSCCGRCNRMKSSLPLNEFLDHLKKMFDYSITP